MKRTLWVLLLPVLLCLGESIRAGAVRTTKLECKSNNYRRSVCTVGGPIERLRLLKKKSNAPCVEGTSFGFTGNTVWVDQGCAAQFEVAFTVEESGTSPGWDTPVDQVLDRKTLECGSRDYRRSRCQVEGPVTAVVLQDRKSNSPCVRDQSFGFENDFIWVDKGCEGKFEVTFRRPLSEDRNPTQGGDIPWWETLGSDRLATTTLRCESSNYGRNICAVGGPIRKIRLRRQRSAAVCEEGVSYGFYEDFVWVDEGCEGDFEVTYRPPAGWDQPPGTPTYREIEEVRFTCKSDDYRRNVCYVPGRIIDLRLRKTKSRAPCSANTGFGHHDDFLWVDQGCEGEFEVTFRVDPQRADDLATWDYSGSGPKERNLSCRSKNYRLGKCSAGGVITGLALRKVKSGAPCKEGETFGFTLDEVWVSEGCEAEFRLTYFPRP